MLVPLFVWGVSIAHTKTTTTICVTMVQGFCSSFYFKLGGITVWKCVWVSHMVQFIFAIMTRVLLVKWINNCRAFNVKQYQCFPVFLSDKASTNTTTKNEGKTANNKFFVCVYFRVKDKLNTLCSSTLKHKGVWYAYTIWLWYASLNIYWCFL